MISEQLKNQILPILKKYPVRKAGVFGSFARNEQKNNSDIDILVEFKKQISLLEFVSIKLELEDLLSKKIDLVEYKTLKSALRKQILLEEQRIL